jgi:hypothetical protein
MIYDLKNPLHRDQFSRRSNSLLEKGCDVVELKTKTSRSLKQNAYLHLILGWFAAETGNTREYVKREYFKRLVNSEIFVTYVEDRWLGRNEVIKSSAEVTKEEMITAIERFRNWSSQEAGIYLPSADEQNYLEQLEIELGRYRDLI